MLLMPPGALDGISGRRPIQCIELLHVVWKCSKMSYLFQNQLRLLWILEALFLARKLLLSLTATILLHNFFLL